MILVFKHRCLGLECAEINFRVAVMLGLGLELEIGFGFGL